MQLGLAQQTVVNWYSFWKQ